jgi:hypothetical protein
MDKFVDAGEIEQSGGTDLVEVELDHHIGAAGDGQRSRLLGLRR